MCGKYSLFLGIPYKIFHAYARVSTMPLYKGEGLGDETAGRLSPNVSECGSHEEIAMRVPNSSHAGNIQVH